MSVHQLGKMNVTWRCHLSRISLFTLVILLVWIGVGIHEAHANESAYEYRDVADGVEITNYLGRDKAITIPETLGGQPVVRIGSSAFANRQLTSVEFPDSVTEIGNSAFDRNKLTSVTLPINVVQIERYAFSSNRLKKIELGPHVSHFEATALAYNPIEEIRVDAGNLTYRDIDGKGLYTADGTLLVAGTASGEIANSVTEIDAFAFSGRGVTSVTIPNLVIKIGESAFAENQLTHLEIPASVTQIDSNAFRDNNLSSVMIGEHVTHIGHAVFQYNQLIHIEIPDSVQTIGNFVFADNQLTQVTLGASVNEFSGSAFLRNPLEKIELAAGNSNLQLAANGQSLYSQDGLRLVIGTVSGEIQDGTTEIGSHAFAGRGLAEITIPASVNTIQGYAFAHNELTNVDIPDGVEEIVNEAFRNNQIKVLKIGKSVQDFTVGAFADNPLAEIKVDGNNSKYKDIDGKGMYTKAGHTLVLGTISGVIEAGTTKIGDYAFRGRGLEGDLTIPSSVTEIDFAAFSTNKLKRVTIPARVNTIGASAFNGNHDLVIFGVKGTKAEAYANEERIPFLSADDPLAVRFEPDGSAGQWQKQAVTKVTVYSYGERETEQYYRWTEENTPPPFDKTTWTSFTSGQEVSQTDAGEWYLHIHAQDSDDNQFDHSSRLFRVVDAPPVDVPPVIHISATVGDEGIPYTEGEWVNQQVHVTIRAKDVNMRELRIKVRHDGDKDEFTVGSEDQFTFKRTFTESGIYQLEITASDAAGQTSTETYTFKISMDGLRLDVRFKQADGTDLSGQWTNQQSVTASVYAYNAQGLSVTDVVYSLNEGETWSPYLTPLTFSDEGTHPLWVKAEDEAGNQLVDQLKIGIDRIKPEIHFEPDGQASALPEVFSKVTVTDEHSGVAEDTLLYSWSTSNQPQDEQADWQAFQRGERLSYTGASGEWYLHIRAQDRAGNEGYQVSRPFQVQVDEDDDENGDGDDGDNGEDDKDDQDDNSGDNGGDSDGDSGGDHHGSYASDYSNANLSELQVSVGQLSPAFSKDITDYRVQVNHDVEQLSLTVKTAQREATIAINGERLSSGQEVVQLPLVEGTNLFNILITAQDGTKKTYTLTIEREQAKADELRTPLQAFTDIAGHWAEGEIKQVVERGIVSGYPDGTFKPNNPVTRAEFTVMLINTLQLEGTNTALTFTDALQIRAWAQQAIAQAIQLDIVAGYEDGSFRPEAPITRAEMAVMIARALKLQLNTNTTTDFADDDAIPHWAKAAVAAIRELGIVNGRGGNHFVPNETATRAEATVMLLRILEEQLGVK